MSNMKETTQPPQLPLDFEGSTEPQRHSPENKKKDNVFRFSLLRRRTLHAVEEMDSVLEEVLSNARKLNW
jgi:hypothetical protein